MDPNDNSDLAYDAIAEDEREQAMADDGLVQAKRIAAALARIANIMEQAFAEMMKV